MFESEQSKQGEGLSKEILYKIEISANRYDLLCLEGLGLALKVFLKKCEMPTFKAINVLPDNERQLIVEKSVDSVRTFGLGAILRGISFTDDSLRAFMDLQDKLHNNICRGRKLVSMGTHDLDTIKGPFYYRALKPKDFKFVPLNRTEEVDGEGMMKILKEDPKLGKYLYLLEDAEVYPLMMDSQGIVMSVPPIINSQHTKMTINTKNVFLDVTGLDYTKSVIVLNTLIAMFSCYSQQPFTCEQIKVVDQIRGTEKEYPDLEPRHFKCDIEYLKTISGLPDVKPEEICNYLKKMELNANILNEKEIDVLAPITRSDILHPCDIAEDLAIAYGFNNVEKKKVSTLCFGKQQPYNKLSDLFRNEMAQYGYVEFLTMALISHKDMFTNLLKEKEDEDTVQLLYSKTKEFEYFRSSLIPGILKSIEANKVNQLPYKIFELSDVVLIDKENEVGASNRRKLCFAYSNTVSGFEIIQGTVDKLMSKIDLSFNNEKNVKRSYSIKPSNDPRFFEDRQAEIYIFEGKKIGIFGVVHPKILKNFGIKNPVTLCEIDIQMIFDLILSGELLEGFY